MDADIKINHHKRTSLSVDFGKRASVSNIIRLANWNLLELSKQESHKDPPSPNSSDPPTPRKRNTLEEEKEILTAPSAQPSREVMQVRRRASSEGWIQAYSLSSSPSPGRVLRRTNSDGLFQSLNEGLVLTSGESYESRSQQSESGSASPRSFTDEFDDIQFEPIIRPRPITKRESVLSLQNKLVTKSEDGRKSVLAASIENLIFKLTTREVPDFDLLHEFLLTYPYYLDSFKLLEYLKDRFEYNPPQGADEALKKDYDEHRPVIRSRVYTVIKTWLKNYSFYFKKDKALLRRVRQFIDIEIGSAKKIWSDQLNALLVFLQLVNSNTNKKKKKKSSARRRNRSALTKGTTPRDNQPGSIEIVTTQSKPLVSKRSKDDLEIGAKPRSDTVFSLSSTNSDDSADTEPDSSSGKFGDFVDMDGPKSNPSIAPPSFLNSFKLSAPKSSAALLAGRDRSDSEASESSSAVSSGAATAGRISPPKIKPLPLKGLPKSSSPSPPNSPVKATVKSSREEVKKPLSGKSNVDSPRTERDRSKSGLRSPLTSPKAPEGEAFRRTHNRVRSTGNARIHAIVSPKDSPNGSLDVVDEEEKQKELEKARIKARVTKYKNELFNANIVKKPRNDFSPLLLSLDPAELAKQLTLVEHKKFSLIAPTELMMTNWKKKDRRTVSKRVCILIEWFNKMTAWVASEIVSAPILKQRVAVITFFIRVCEACKELNNYNTLMEILSGLDMTAVVRLKSTWEHVSKKDMQSLEELRDIVSRNDNYSRYRQEVDAINTPTPYLPYIGLLLQDLVALEELPTIDRDGLVNFRKFKRVSKILQRVHDLKILNFKLEPVVPLQKYLKKGLQVLGDMDLLRFSRVCEPSQQAMLF